MVQYNKVTIKSVNPLCINSWELFVLWCKHLRLRHSRLYIAEYSGAVLGYCLAEHIVSYDAYVVSENIGVNFRAQVLNAVRYVLFETTGCASVETKLFGEDKDVVATYVEGASIMDEDDGYRVVWLKTDSRVLV